MTERETRDMQTRKYQSIDYSLLFLTIFMVVFGLIMVYSTSSYNAAKYYNDPTLYLRKQGIFAVAGIVAMIGIALVIRKTGYLFVIKKYKFLPVRLVTVLYFFCVFLQVLVLVVGDEIKGAKRWIEIPGIGSFQPSEVTKVCIIFFTSYLVYFVYSISCNNL